MGVSLAGQPRKPRQVTVAFAVGDVVKVVKRGDPRKGREAVVTGIAAHDKNATVSLVETT